MPRRSHSLMNMGAALAALLVITQPTPTPAQGLGMDEEVSVIVTLADQVSPSDFAGPDMPRGRLRARLITALKAKAGATQGPLVAFLNGRGASRVVPLWLINGLAVTAPAEVIEELARFPEIESIRPDARIKEPPSTQGTAAAEWNLDMVGAPQMWTAGYTGSGIVVANLDTGVDAYHQDLASRWRGGSNSWFDPNGQHATPYDRTGHGTGTMGVLVGGDAGGTAIGMAPDAQWIAVKIFNDAGTASLSAIHQGFQWVLDPDGNPATDDAADVVSNSWGFEQSAGTCYQEFEPDLEVLKAAGIAVVFSAGNVGPYASTSVSPANNPEGYAVGAVDDTGTVADFSSRGPSACDGSIYPQVVAPGVSVTTADLTFGGVFPDSYVSVSGTSFAAPHVAGAMALLAGAHPEATVADLEQALTDTAVDLGDGGPDDETGYGLIDVVAADTWLASLPGDPPPPANLPPVANDDAAQTRRNKRLANFSVVANDVDPDGTIDVATVVITSGQTTSQGGRVTAKSDGTVTYTPKKKFIGTDSFTYVVNDDGGATSNVALVEVQVVP